MRSSAGPIFTIQKADALTGQPLRVMLERAIEDGQTSAL